MVFITNRSLLAKKHQGVVKNRSQLAGGRRGQVAVKLRQQIKAVRLRSLLEKGSKIDEGRAGLENYTQAMGKTSQ